MPQIVLFAIALLGLIACAVWLIKRPAFDSLVGYLVALSSLVTALAAYPSDFDLLRATPFVLAAILGVVVAWRRRAAQSDKHLMETPACSGSQEDNPTSGNSIKVGDITGSTGVAVGPGATVIIQHAAPPLSPKPRFIVPFPHNEHFVGRDEELKRLHVMLQGGETAGVRPAMLSGLGGIGKTQLAVEYAYRFQGDYPGGVYWVNAAQDWQEELATLASRIGLQPGNMPESERRQQLALALADFLNTYPDALLIFDNVEDPRILRTVTSGFVPTELKCRLLFTTRRRDPDLPFAQIEVRALPEEAALKLLLHKPTRRILLAKLDLDGSVADLSAARAICRSLGYLPLALELASAYLGKHAKISLSGYRGRLEKEGGLATVDASGADALDLPTRHDAAIEATLRSQWNALKSTEARRVLQAASLLGEAAQLPRARLALLVGIADEAEVGYAAPLDEALIALYELSLVEELTEHEIRLHPLVQKFAQATLTDRQATAANLAGHLAEALWNCARLHGETARRGIDAVLGDLHCALDLAPIPQDVLRLTELLRPLDLEAHHLRRWDPVQQPGFFAQQLRNRCFELGTSELQSRAEALLAERGWPFLSERHKTIRESSALVRTLEGHSGEVRDVAVTPDGQQAVSASTDRTLRIWDLESGQSLRTLRGHTNDVVGVAVTPDGSLAVSASYDHTLIVWDLGSGQAVYMLEGHMGSVNSVAITPDGQRAVSASEDNTLKVWDLGSGRILRTLKGHTDWARAVGVTPDGQRAVSASHDCTLRVWDLATGQVLDTLEGHTGWVTAVAVTSDGQQAVSASDDGTLKVWNLNNGETLRTLKGLKDSVWDIAVTPDGRRAVIASEDSTITVWDLNSGRPLPPLEGHAYSVSGVVVTPDGRRVVSASDDRTLKVWDLDKGSALDMPEGHIVDVNSVAVTSDGQRVVSASVDNTLKVWDLRSGHVLHTLKGHTSTVYGVTVTPDGRQAVSASDDRTLKVWDLDTGKVLRTLDGPTSGLGAVAVTPDGRRVLSESDDSTLKVWDLESGLALFTLEGFVNSVYSIAVTPDGQRAVAASSDGTIKVWDLESGRALYTREGHSHWVWSVAVTPDGQRAISASLDRTLKVWDLATGQILQTLKGHTIDVRGVAITPDGRRIVSISSDCTLKVWDLTSGQLILTLATNAPLDCCAAAPDNRTIIAGDSVGALHFVAWVQFEQASDTLHRL